MTFDQVTADAEGLLDWVDLTEAMIAGHRLPEARIGDTFLYRGNDTLLCRSAWIDGLGIAVKTGAVFPGNRSVGKPTIMGVVNLFSDADGSLEAMLDFGLVTKWKTAADSLLSARLLARPGSRRFLLVGAGVVARSMVEAYRAVFPAAEFTVWSRTEASARSFAAETGASVATDLESAVRNAEVIATATMTGEPLIRGAWLQPGTHLDLIGAYTPAMREVDNDAMARARVFVDARATTVHHIGELMTPIAQGAMRESDVLGDFYDIASGAFARRSDSEITIAKNGGGAHLDLITARYILSAWRARPR
jgi:ornithine cyclodeaminase